MLLHDKLWVIKNESTSSTSELASEFGISNANDILEIDMQLNIKDIGFDLIEEIKKSKPFEPNNPRPLYCYRRITVTNIIFFGDENQHIKLEVEDENRMLDCIGLNLAKDNKTLVKGEIIDIAFTLETNWFKGIETIQLNLIDIRRRCEEGYKTKSLIQSYYSSFPNLFKNIDYSEMDYILDNVVDFTNIKDRASYITKNIDSNENNLILVNTIEGLIDLNLFLFDNNRLDIINSMSFNTPIDNKFNSIIVVNPILNKFNFEKYDNIYIYDVPVIKEELSLLMNCGGKIHCLYNNNDIKPVDKFLKNVIPNRDDLVDLYKYLKQFLDNKEISYQDLINDISTMNYTKLAFSIDILSEAELIRHEQMKEKIAIELLPPPKEKIDITATKLYKKITKVTKGFKNYSRAIFNIAFE